MMKAESFALRTDPGMPAGHPFFRKTRLNGGKAEVDEGRFLGQGP
jgi:hypothetical protein